MVGEFPKLQGVMGRYYASRSGESDDVALAIGEHYLPAYSGDRLPSNATGQIVSVADRLDTLVGIFAIGLKPTGNKDPFALRRAALGLIRILLDGRLDIDLDSLLTISVSSMQSKQTVSDDVVQELRGFILDRLKHYLREQGYETSHVNAALDAPLNTLPDLVARLDALQTFMSSEVAPGMAAANKRISNILRKSEATITNTIDDSIMVIEEERILFADIRGISKELTKLYQQANYTAALTLLAGLSAGVEAFFDKVMVMDDDPKIRSNRLNLLAELKGLFDRIANLAMVG